MNFFRSNKRPNHCETRSQIELNATQSSEKPQISARDKTVRFEDECTPQHPKYRNIFKRMDSFKERSWPPGIPQKPRKLADAGFYYTGIYIRLLRKSDFLISSTFLYIFICLFEHIKDI